MRAPARNDEGMILVQLVVWVECFLFRFGAVDRHVREGGFGGINAGGILTVAVGVVDFLFQVVRFPRWFASGVPEIPHQHRRRRFEHAHILELRRDTKRRLIPTLPLNGGERVVFEVPLGATIRVIGVHRYGIVSDSALSSCICPASFDKPGRSGGTGGRSGNGIHAMYKGASGTDNVTSPTSDIETWGENICALAHGCVNTIEVVPSC